MRQRLPIDTNRFGGIPGGLQRLRNNKRNCIADVTDLPAGEHRVQRHRNVHTLEQAVAGHRPQPGHLGSGQHQPHARQGAHAGEIMKGEARVCVRRSEHDRIQHAGRRHVGDVAP